MLDTIFGKFIVAFSIFGLAFFWRMYILTGCLPFPGPKVSLGVVCDSKAHLSIAIYTLVLGSPLYLAIRDYLRNKKNIN